MSKSTFEEEIEKSGVLHYTTVGVSMLPLLHQHSDIIAVYKPQGRLKKYDVALYKMPDGRYILHRILKVRDSDYIICGDNCIRKEYGITDDNIIGVMKEYIKKGKTHTVDSLRYKLYSHLIVDFYPLKAVFLRIKWLIKRIMSKLKKIIFGRGRK